MISLCGNSKPNMVMVLVDETQPEGEHRAGLGAASLVPGTYVLVLDADGQRVSRAITVVR